jgi:hypothetical protein
VTFEMLTEMRNKVQKCKELVERAKRTISMPRAPSGGDSSASATKKNKRGLESMLEKSWATQDRKHLDALIARAFYLGGMHYAGLQILGEAFMFACSNSLFSCFNFVLN